MPTKDWILFKKNVLDKSLKGYTEINCQGYWIDQNNNSLSENCKAIIYVNMNTKKERKMVDFVVNTYKEMFNQESVLVVNSKVKAKF